VGEVAGLVLGGWDVAERFVQAAGVEPANVLHSGELELGAGAPDTISDKLGLEAVDERLGEGIIVGISDRADRDQDAVVVERLGVVAAQILRSPDALMFVKGGLGSSRPPFSGGS